MDNLWCTATIDHLKPFNGFNIYKVVISICLFVCAIITNNPLLPQILIEELGRISGMFIAWLINSNNTFNFNDALYNDDTMIHFQKHSLPIGNLNTISM